VKRGWGWREKFEIKNQKSKNQRGPGKLKRVFLGVEGFRGRGQPKLSIFVICFFKKL
jgi:hypothetical protein